MGRCESLLAWLSSFGGPFEGLHEDPEGWELLQDGRLLLSLLLCLDAKACYTTEYEAYRLRTPVSTHKDHTHTYMQQRVSGTIRNIFIT